MSECLILGLMLSEGVGFIWSRSGKRVRWTPRSQGELEERVCTLIEDLRDPGSLFSSLQGAFGKRGDRRVLGNRRGQSQEQ